VGRTRRLILEQLRHTATLTTTRDRLPSEVVAPSVTDGLLQQSIMLGRGPAPGVELRVAIQVVRRRLGDEFREPAESELSAGVTSPPVSGSADCLTPDDFLR
jgi:hypothetical protein